MRNFGMSMLWFLMDFAHLYCDFFRSSDGIPYFAPMNLIKKKAERFLSGKLKKY